MNSNETHREMVRRLYRERKEKDAKAAEELAKREIERIRKLSPPTPHD